jgi:hypothetical protein
MAGVVWFFAPLLRGLVPNSKSVPESVPGAEPVKAPVSGGAGPSRGGGTTGAPRVISALVDDPWRSQSALRIWNQSPGAILVFQGNAEYQAITFKHLSDRGLWPQDTSRLLHLHTGCDTVGQVTALARMLENWSRPGRLTIVTAETHLARTLAIAHIVFAGTGWQIDGSEAVTGDLRPESELRLRRDQLRASLWRLTGWDGRLDGNDCR